jgi:hypothetical protein
MPDPLPTYKEEVLAAQLRRLVPPPAAWVQAAKELPAARRELDGIVERARADAVYRSELLADLEGALRRAGHVDDSARVAALRARLAGLSRTDLCN